MMTTKPGDPRLEIITLEMTNEELTATINLLDFSITAFEGMAKAAHAQNDVDSLRHIQVRIAFAKMLAAKLIQSLELGDTKNRTFH